MMGENFHITSHRVWSATGPKGAFWAVCISVDGKQPSFTYTTLLQASYYNISLLLYHNKMYSDSEKLMAISFFRTRNFLPPPPPRWMPICRAFLFDTKEFPFNCKIKDLQKAAMLLLLDSLFSRRKLLEIVGEIVYRRISFC